MKFTCTKSELLAPLSRVVAVANPKSTLPILANVLLRIDGGRLSMTCSDLESELVSSIPVDGPDGAITVPARKLLDVVKVMADTPISLATEAEKLIVKCGRSRHQLVTLPAIEYPASEATEFKISITVDAADLRRMIDRVDFAMAASDVRFYLNGAVIEIRSDGIRCVATDGHRLAYSGASGDVLRSVIVPRKAILEISKMLNSGPVDISVGDRAIRVTSGGNVATCRLIDGRYPEYERIVSDQPLVATCNRLDLIDSLRRAAVLSHEKFRGVRLEFGDGVKITSGNSDNDASTEIVDAEDCAPLAAGWKVDYLMDALGALTCEMVSIRATESSALITDGESVHVVSCLRL